MPQQNGRCFRPRPYKQLRQLTAATAVVSTLGLVSWTGAAQASASRAAPKAVHASLRDRAMSYLGVFENGSPRHYGPVEEFGKTTGRQPNIVQYYLGWNQFQVGYARTAWKHKAALIVDIDPIHISVGSIVAGRQNSHLESLAKAVRSFAHPVIISFGQEMNGRWYSWGWKHTNPKTFVRAWRHIVQIFQRAGADNVTWLWTINALGPNEGPTHDWWPGAKYVTWVGIDGYLYKRKDTFASEFGRSITAVRKLTHKPIFLAETAVGPAAGQAAKIPSLFAGAKRAHLLGLLWFDVAQRGSMYKRDWRLEGHRAAIAAFRKAARKYLRLVKP